MSGDSSSQEEMKRKADQEHRKTELAQEISSIGKTLSPLRSSEALALVTELDDQKRLLVLSNPKGTDDSEYALSFIQNQINEIKEKANQESQKSFLLEQISKIQESLNSVKTLEASAVIRKIDSKTRTLKSVLADGSESSFSKLSLLHDEIEELRKQADSISRRSQQESRKLFLLEDLAGIKELLSSSPNIDPSSLNKKIDEKKRIVELLPLSGDEVASYDLSTLQTEVDALREEARSMIDKGEAEVTARKQGLRGLLRSLGDVVRIGKITWSGLLTLVAVALVIYVAYLLRVQLTTEPTGTPVSFINPETNRADVRLIITQDGENIHKGDIPPGGIFTVDILLPGEYEFEVSSLYPPITPSAPNCYAQWQLGDSYKANLTITSEKTTIEIQHFDLEAEEICFAETPVPIPPNPTN